jgi:hypothetical protein
MTAEQAMKADNRAETDCIDLQASSDREVR